METVNKEGSGFFSNNRQNILKGTMVIRDKD